MTEGFNSKTSEEFFQQELIEYLEEYEKELGKTLSQSMVNKYSIVIGYGIECICLQGATGFEEITLSMVSSKLHADFESNTQEGVSRKHIAEIMYKFFSFIYDRYGIRNEKLMKQLERKK